jgi:hypothetical protein
MRELCRKDLPASTQDHLFYLLKIGKYEQHHKDPRFGGRSRCSEESSTNRTLSSDASTNTSHQISGTATTVVTGTACSSLITSKESISVLVPEETVESTSPDTGTTLPLPPLEVAPSVAPATSQSEDVVITEEDIDDPPDPLCPQTQRPILSNILTEEERSQLAELRASCLTDDESYSSRVMSSLRKIDDLLSNESKELEEIKSQLISSSIK